MTLTRLAGRTRVGPFEDGTLCHLADLTPHQREIACAVAVGYSNAQIAERLNVSLSTVRNHLSEIYRQTGLISQRALIAWVVSEADPRWRLVMTEIEERLSRLPPHYCKGKRFVHTAGVIECIRFVLTGQTERPS